MPQGLIAEHLSERRPARIQNGFCHPHLGQTRSVHLTNDDAAMLTHKPRRLLRQGVSPAISYFGMQRSFASFLSTLLRQRQLRLMPPIKGWHLYLATVAECGKIVQSKGPAPARRSWT